MKIVSFLTLVTLILFTSSVSAKMYVTKERQGGILWHYDRVNQEVTSDGLGNTLVALHCFDPGFSRCRPSNVSGPSSIVMDDAESTIEVALSQNITSGTINYSNEEYYVVWSATETSVTETWYTYAEAQALGLL